MFYQGDIEDKSFLAEIFKKYSISKVINLAARAGAGIVLPTHLFTQVLIIMEALNLLDLMRENNISKYVMASTSSIYAGTKCHLKKNLV